MTLAQNRSSVRRFLPSSVWEVRHLDRSASSFLHPADLLNKTEDPGRLKPRGRFSGYGGTRERFADMPPIASNTGKGGQDPRYAGGEGGTAMLAAAEAGTGYARARGRGCEGRLGDYAPATCRAQAGHVEKSGLHQAEAKTPSDGDDAEMFRSTGWD